MVQVKGNKVIGVDAEGNKISMNCDFRSTIHRVERVKADPSLYEGYGDTGMCRQISYNKGHMSYVGPANLAVCIHNGIAEIGVHINSLHTCNFKININ